MKSRRGMAWAAAMMVGAAALAGSLPGAPAAAQQGKQRSKQRPAPSPPPPERPEPAEHPTTPVTPVTPQRPSASRESRDARPPDERPPRTPAELLAFLPGTYWKIQSQDNDYYGQGMIVFRAGGVVEHVYADDVVEKKHWGVNDRMQVVWGGTFLRIMSFEADFTRFRDDRGRTTGLRLREHVAQ